MNDIVVFLVLAGIALVFKWLGTDREKPTSTNQSPAAPRPRPVNRAPAESEAERVRRFLEALGAPPGSNPPEPVRPLPAPMPPVVSTRPARVKRNWAQPLPPLVTMPELETPPPPLPPAALPPPLPVAGAARPFVRPTPRPSLAPPPALSLGELLRSPASARQAIVLREVFGPPRGLVPFVGESF